MRPERKFESARQCLLVAYGTDSWALYTNTACRMAALALGGAGACALRIPQLRERLLSRLPALSALVLVFVPGRRCPDARL